MPRSSEIHHPALRSLVEQLRFSGRGALLRQIQRAEALAGELDPSFAYPVSFILERITGYSGVGGGAGGRGDEGDVVGGAALFADLSAVVERLCVRARLGPGDLPAGSVTPEELGARWGVSRRTVERYRRRGLVARRVRADDGSVRVYLTPSVVRAFEAANLDRLRIAGRRTRISAEERDRIVSRAVRYRERLGWSATAIAARLGVRHGRSREAIRLVLERALGDAGGGALGVRHPLSEDERAELAGAYARGERVGEIAARFGIARSGVTRVVCERTVAGMRVALEAWRESLGESGSGCGELAALDSEAARRADRHRSGLLVAWAEDARSLVRGVEGVRMLDPEIERERSVLSVAIPAGVLEEISGLRGRSASLERVDGWVVALRHGMLLKRTVAHGLVGAGVRALEERLGAPLEALDAASAGEAYVEMMRTIGLAIDRHGLGHGRRAAGQVAQLLGWRAGRRTGLGMGEPRARALVRLPRPEALIAPWWVGVAPQPPLVRLIERALGDPAVLGFRAPEGWTGLMAMRLALADESPLSLGEIGDRLGISRAMAIALEHRARAAIGGSGASAEGDHLSQ
ncbi:MAG: hypothetical protein ACTS3F_09770 [Phycisphaerales bacterium]